jgi:phosphatidate cytidylyltransferase
VTSRLLSTFALWGLVFLAVGLLGVTGGVVLLALLTFLAQHELHDLLQKCGLPPWRAPCIGMGLLLVLGAAGLTISADLANFAWLAGAVALIFGVLAAGKKHSALHRVAGSVLAVAYVPGLLQYYALIMRDFGPDCPAGAGLGLAIWVVAVAKFTDVGGYLAGSVFGRHKLAPSISPGKTWEGVVGGLMLSALVGGLGAQYAAQFLPKWFEPSYAAALTVPIAVASIISDLSESVFKRCAGVKDSGNCIPGIGGALDLADSLLLAAPVAYYLFIYTKTWA